MQTIPNRLFSPSPLKIFYLVHIKKEWAFLKQVVIDVSAAILGGDNSWLPKKKRDIISTEKDTKLKRC